MVKTTVNSAEKSLEREKLLNKIISSIRNSLDINEVKKSIVVEVGKAFNANRCFMKLNNDNDSTLSIDNYSEYIGPDEVNTLSGYKFDDTYTQTSHLGYMNNDSFIIYDTDEFNIDIKHMNKVVKTVHSVFKAKSSYSFPIFIDDKLIGAFYVQYSKKSIKLTSGDIEVLKAIASQAGFAIKQANMYSIIKKQAEREELLRKLTENIRNSLDFDKVIDSVGKELFELFNVDKVAISKYTRVEGKCVWQFLVEHEKTNLPKLKSISPCESTAKLFASELYNHNHCVIIDDVEKSSYPGFFLNIYRELGVKSLLAIPIIRNNKRWGAIGLLEYSNVRKWSHEEINLIKEIADTISIAIKQAEMYSIIKKQTITDNILKSNESIVINQNLSANIGLTPAITFSVLTNKYNLIKNQTKNKSNKNKFFEIELKELLSLTNLSDIELRQSLEKLCEIELIKLKKESDPTIINIKLTDEKGYIDYFLKKHPKKNDNEYFKQLKTEASRNDYNNLKSTYSGNFSKASVDATKYFLTKSRQINIFEHSKISNLYFLVVCRTLNDFMSNNKINLTNIKKIIDELCCHSPECRKVIDIKSTNHIFAKRLKKILIYRFQEAQSYIVTDLNSKVDFYTCLAKEDVNFIENLLKND